MNRQDVYKRQDIFRLDAIPYLSKEDGTSAENQPKTHAILKLISNYIQMTAPRTVKMCIRDRFSSLTFNSESP